MGSGGFEDQVELLAKGTGAEEEDHDEGMGKADFGTINGAVAHGFDEGEVVGIVGVEDDTIYGVLWGVRDIEYIITIG